MRHPLIRSHFVRPAVYERARESRTFPASRLSFAGSVRVGLLALAAAFLFLFALLCTTAFLIEGHCGERFGYYGCDLQH
jgi:hypothetical protein